MQAAATRLGLSDRAGRGGLAPGSFGQAPLHCSTSRGMHPRLRPATDLPACLPRPLLLLATKRQVFSLAKCAPQGVLSPSCTDPPTGWGSERSCCSQAHPPERSREGWGAQGRRQGRGGGSRNRSEAGRGRSWDHSASGAPCSWMAKGQDGARVSLPMLSSWVASRHEAGLHPFPLPRPERAGPGGGACSAEQLQVGDGDLALLVASLANEPVGVHARQAVDSDELKRVTEKEGHAPATRGPCASSGGCPLLSCSTETDQRACLLRAGASSAPTPRTPQRWGARDAGSSDPMSPVPWSPGPLSWPVHPDCQSVPVVSRPTSSASRASSLLSAAS